MADILSIEEREQLRHKMLPLSANPDFDELGTELINPYYDVSTDLKHTGDILGTAALDQAIENLICTEPCERLFNVNFWSPLYRILFENSTNIDAIGEQVFQQIENYVPVKIDRASAKIEFTKYTNELEISFPYFYDFHGQTHKHNFQRIIGR